MMATGKVKWFNEIKGYGFILSDDSSFTNQDIFVHQSVISERLTEGCSVEFEIEKNTKGLRALNVKKLAS